MRVRGNRMGVDAAADSGLRCTASPSTAPLAHRTNAWPQSPKGARPQLWFGIPPRRSAANHVPRGASPAGFVYCSMATAGVSLLERQKRYQEAIDRLHQMLGEVLELGNSGC